MPCFPQLLSSIRWLTAGPVPLWTRVIVTCGIAFGLVAVAIVVVNWVWIRFNWVWIWFFEISAVAFIRITTEVSALIFSPTIIAALLSALIASFVTCKLFEYSSATRQAFASNLTAISSSPNKVLRHTLLFIRLVFSSTPLLTDSLSVSLPALHIASSEYPSTGWTHAPAFPSALHSLAPSQKCTPDMWTFPSSHS